jgi:hypothetical protein
MSIELNNSNHPDFATAEGREWFIQHWKDGAVRRKLLTGTIENIVCILGRAHPHTGMPLGKLEAVMLVNSIGDLTEFMHQCHFMYHRCEGEGLVGVMELWCRPGGSPFIENVSNHPDKQRVLMVIFEHQTEPDRAWKAVITGEGEDIEIGPWEDIELPPDAFLGLKDCYSGHPKVGAGKDQLSEVDRKTLN